METRINKIFRDNIKKVGGVSKKLTAFLLAAFIGTGLIHGTGAYFSKKDKEISNSVTTNMENEIGYNDINPVYNCDVHANEFVILHIKNKDIQDISLLKAKINKCNESNISIGLVLDTDADNLSDIYKDVDFLQAVIKEFQIDLPIYCNIDNIMNNEKLNNAMKASLVEAFIDKASHSKMFLGLYGSDTSLYNFNEYIFNIEDYNCYIVLDDDERKYMGPTTIVEDQDGVIKASYDLSQVIIQKGLNSPSKLVYSSLYTVEEGDTYESLALQYGLSVEDLKDYNGKILDTLKVGDIIKIPNMYITYDSSKNEVQYNYAIARGIDISDYQTLFDWKRISSTSDYVIVEVARDRSNYQENEGKYLSSAKDQIINVLENDLDLGLYFCISEDMNINEYTSRLNGYLNNLVRDLEGVDIDFSKVPVFLDFEVYYEYNDYYGLMQAFEKTCKSYGFCTFGIYGNASVLRAINKNMEERHSISLKDTDYKIWQSGGPQYSSSEATDPGIKLEDLIEINNSTDKEAGFTPDMRQVTNVCIDTGAQNGAGHCDVSYLYTNDIFGNALPPTEDLIDVMEIDLANYKNLSLYDFSRIADMICDYVFKATGLIISVSVLSVGLGSIVVGLYRKQKYKRKK